MRALDEPLLDLEDRPAAGALPDPARAVDRLVACTLLLLGVGVCLAGTTAPPGATLEALRRHAAHVLLGLACLLLASRVPPGLLRRAAPGGYAVAVALLALVLVPRFGVVENHARRWFRLGALSFQPSEFAKLAGIVFLADLAARKGEGMRELRSGFLPGFAGLLLPASLVLAEPDFGTAIYLLLVFTALLAVGGARIRHFVAALALAAPVFAVVAWSKFEHVRARLGTLAGRPTYQVEQSIVALGSGGVLGRGLGEGEMKRGFVPLGHNDFVFAILGEETGLVGTLLVLGLFGATLHAGLRAAQGLRGDPFASLLVFGVVFAIGLQAAVNLAVVTGLAPPKGISLPFVSAGGTSIAVLASGVGFAASAARRSSPSPGSGGG
ncbi:MAG TPA: FtsW/RodA/SpoVE family cell cycle protein [Planctomycetota bacterium]|nr:FtsW/RodA/SpoVE family cell cycle protein [Planctomycetota bacterium]